MEISGIEVEMPTKYDLATTNGNGKPHGEEGNFVNPVYSDSRDNVNSDAPSASQQTPPPPYDDITEPSANGSKPPAYDDINNADKAPVAMASGTGEAGKKDEDDKKKEPDKMVGATETFRFATCTDRLLMILGTVAALIHGAALPLMIIIFGDMSDSFISDGTVANQLTQRFPLWQQGCTGAGCGNYSMEYLNEDPNPPDRYMAACGLHNDPEFCSIMTDAIDLLGDMKGYTVYYVIIGIGSLVLGYLQVLCWQIAAYNQTQRIRTKLFWAILRQEISWFDTHEIGELNNRLTDDVNKIESGIGDKLGLFWQWISSFIAGIIIGFVYDWKLTLVILAVSPLLALAGGLMGKLGSAMTGKELAAYAKAGAVAEEVFGAIRTVVAFGGQAKECTRYNANLQAAHDFGVKKAIINAASMGVFFLVMFGSYGLAFWYGSKLFFEGQISPGELMIVFFCVLIGAFSLGNATPNLQDFASARGAAYAVYGIIDGRPAIDSSAKTGRTEENITGNLEFKNVHFNYPSRPEVKVLNGLSVKINVGQTVALVGSSGCGKSTTVQLIQRFYDPAVGEITLDGTDIREYNVSWLRQQMGIVSQEPVLFACTIADNIRYGHDGLSMDDIIRACKEANAHDFVTKLPDGYNTMVGERGAQLSGGQKQRIAIARALVRNPKVLLLDEATSALDTESEASVQAALDVARQGRTTLVIAHRLSTIRTADVIVGVRDGQVVEQGTHDELMARNGLYAELCNNQKMDDEEIDLEADDMTSKVSLDRVISHRGSGRKLKRGMSSMSNGSGVHNVSSADVKKEDLPSPGMGQMMKMNASEWPLLVIGCFCALLVGSVQPAFAVIFSDILGIYAGSGDDRQQKVYLYSGLFVAIGAIAGLGMLGMGICFGKAGETLTRRLRELCFQALLKQEIAFFDDHSNNVGALCTRLATDASMVQGATGSRLSTFCQSLAGIGAGIVIGFIYSWKLTLLIFAFIPLMVISGVIQMKVMSGTQDDKRIALEKAGKVAIEAVENIRTVAGLTKEVKFHEDYLFEITKPHKANKKKAHVQAFGYAFSNAIIFFAYAAAFGLGAYLVEQRELEFQNMFKVFMALVFGAMAAGQASAFAPDYGKAQSSSAKIIATLEREPPIDSSSTEGRTLDAVQGSLGLRGVKFNYPTRPDVAVMTGLDLNVTPGQTVALVGSSGCGKSTTVQLLERFYDPLEGDVTLDGQDIRELNLSWLRRQMGIVSQEPILFDTSIRENIAYGDNSRDIPMAEIIEAAKNANIHSFIENLPQGYDTNVGDKGAQLSGGQKQRIAIARALVRNPKVLLLDEATSALDTESEKVVQAALDRAQEGRTCIVIAHRLSTIQNADCIMVIHHGNVVEMGTHQELLQMRGRYHKLNNAQLSKS